MQYYGMTSKEPRKTRMLCHGPALAYLKDGFSPGGRGCSRFKVMGRCEGIWEGAFEIHELLAGFYCILVQGFCLFTSSSRDFYAYIHTLSSF